MQTYVFAAASQQVGAMLQTTRNQPVTVNGNSVASGTTVLPGSSIETPAGVGATLQMGFAVLDMSPETEVTLEFSPGGPVTVTLKRGCVVLRTMGDAEGTIITPDGGTVKTGDDKRAEVCHPRRDGAPPVPPGAGGHNGLVLAVLLGATAGAFFGLLLPGRGENPSQSTP
ncbi:MAG TPA: hypothetical protein VJT74_01825 [Pyrinomonadaceae bacterium]|nr:hypothetical protein [Pyrinomonadaceae bacterium]